MLFPFFEGFDTSLLHVYSSSRGQSQSGTSLKKVKSYQEAMKLKNCSDGLDRDITNLEIFSVFGILVFDILVFGIFSSSLRANIGNLCFRGGTLGD